MPERDQRSAQTQAELDIGLPSPRERGAQVVPLRLEALQPSACAGPPSRCGSASSVSTTKCARVTPPQVGCLVGILEPLRRVLADRLEHPVAPVGEAQQALLGKRLHAVEIRLGFLFGLFQSAASREHGQAAEQALLFAREQVVAPGDRRPKRLLAGIGITASLKRSSRCERRSRIWAGVSAFVRASELDRRGKLSRRVQSSAISPVASGPERSQKRDGLGLHEGRNLVLHLALHSQANVRCRAG